MVSAHDVHESYGTSLLCFLVQTVSSLLLCTSAYIVFRRRWMRIQLSAGKCGLPTVCWLPRFVNYLPEKDDDDGEDPNKDNYTPSKSLESMDTHTPESESGCQTDSGCHEHKLPHKKLPSSNITNILPRMERLNGPYGMYATVYGISTKVVHVAHPIPAKAVLMGHGSGIPISLSKSKSMSIKTSSVHKSTGRIRKRSSMAMTLGAIKRPAYNHFFNFFGEGVFTADGFTWKSKRASVIHCLLKNCTKDSSEESLRLEREANRAADKFLWSACDCSKQRREVNIVPLLQRSTIGLIYRFLTHHDIETHFQRNVNGNDDDNVEDSTNLASYPVINMSTGEENIASLISVSDVSEQDTEDDSASHSSTSSSTIATKQEGSKSLDHTNHRSTTSMNDDDDNDHDDKYYRRNPFRDLSSYLEAITKIRMIILAQSRSIWFLLPRWCYRFFSSMFQEEERQMMTIRKFAKAACLNAQIGSPLHMLRFRDSHNNDPDTSKKERVQDGTITNKALLDEAITLLFAGQDTSAATLSWALHLLSLNPNVQKRLAKEIKDHLDDCEISGLSPNSSSSSGKNVFTKKMVMKMTYLDAVVKEVMRLYPVAPFVVRNVPEDLTIPGDPSNTNNGNDDITIPKDTLACIWIYSLHRNQKLWNRPDEFIPERWMDPELQKLDAAQSNSTLKGSFMPFAAGPRNCVGQPLAHIVLRIMLSRIIHECEVIDERRAAYSASLTEDEMVERGVHLRRDMQAGFTVLPSGGVSLSVRRRMKLE